MRKIGTTIIISGYITLVIDLILMISSCALSTNTMNEVIKVEIIIGGVAWLTMLLGAVIKFWKQE